MNNETLGIIQEKLGYRFKNEKLLMQAFTRRSYSEEHNGTYHNEVLEFYGDKALELIVMKKMSEYYGNIGENGFFDSKNNEGTLTEIKKKLVCREALASRIRKMDVQKYLLVGKGDIEQKMWEQESVQEDLFESIIGAIAMDSNWNLEILTDVVERMLDPEAYFEDEGKVNYIELIQQWSQTKYHMPPLYTFVDGDLSNKDAKAKYQCVLSLSPFPPFFKGFGDNKSLAKMMAAREAYEYLEKSNLLCSLIDFVGTPNLDRAINQLQELYQKGYILEPQYVFSESYDENGNPIWHCNCSVTGINYPDMGSVSHSSKKQAKKMAAFRLLSFFLNEEKKHETV